MDTKQVLSIIDWIFTATAVVVLASFWWQGRRRKFHLASTKVSELPSKLPSKGLQADAPGHQNPLADFPLHSRNTLKEDAILWAVIGYVAGAALLSAVGLQLWGEDGGVPASILIGSGSQVLGAIVCIGLANSRFNGGGRGFLFGTGDSTAMAQARVTMLAVVCAWGLCPAVLEMTVFTIKLISPGFELPEHPTIDALTSQDQTSLLVILLWIGAAVVAPIAEEVFFRGFVQTLLRNLVRNRSAAIIGASIIFAGIHFPQQPHAVPALIVLAGILGYAYERTGSLVPAFLVHGLFNLKTLIWHHIGSMPT